MMAPVRRLSVGALSCLVVVNVASASHGHRHVHLREPAPAIATQVVTVPVKVYEYHGILIPENEACEGIKNGTLHWAPGSKNMPDCTVSKTSVSVPVNTPTMIGPPTPPVKHEPLPVATFSTVIVQSAQHSAASSTSPAKASSTSPVAIGPVQGGVFHQDNTNVHMDFPDGELECSEFPSSYGPIHIPWMNMGGWTGIQYADIANDLVVGLATGVHGNVCAESDDGSTTFCSYACPPGYQKSQWPSTQGGSSMAVSVGGLKCVNGKLHLTNPDLSSKLCIPGTGKSFVTNKLGGSASICRTDYPGTEDETIPLETLSGETYPLTCPDASTYYQHLGAQTSAQYYVNNKGIAVEEACQWGQDGTNKGNWAPVVIGTETDTNGATWLSIMTSRQNNPSDYHELNYSIELIGDFGGSACFYTQHEGVGYYCTRGSLADFTPSQTSCKSFDPSAGVTVPGCTVQLFSGTATYHLVETN